MPKLNFAIEYNESLGVKEKKFMTAAKDACEETVKEWQTNWITDHFKQGADQVYSYKQRSKRYQARKDRKNLPPLVWTGKSMRFIKNKSFHTLTRSRKDLMATGKWAGLEEAIPYFLIKPRGRNPKPGSPPASNRPDLVDELMRVSNQDIQRAHEFFVDKFYHFLFNPKKKSASVKQKVTI